MTPSGSDSLSHVRMSPNSCSIATRHSSTTAFPALASAECLVACSCKNCLNVVLMIVLGKLAAAKFHLYYMARRLFGMPLASAISAQMIWPHCNEPAIAEHPQTGLGSSPSNQLCGGGFSLAIRGKSSFLNIRCASSRSEEHTSELQSPMHLVCRLLLEI